MIFWSKMSSASFGPFLYAMLANACSKQWNWPVFTQSSIVVLSGLNPAATERPPVAVCVATETKSATDRICEAFSLPLNDGIPTPPLRT